MDFFDVKNAEPCIDCGTPSIMGICFICENLKDTIYNSRKWIDNNIKIDKKITNSDLNGIINCVGDIIDAYDEKYRMMKMTFSTIMGLEIDDRKKYKQQLEKTKNNTKKIALRNTSDNDVCCICLESFKDLKEEDVKIICSNIHLYHKKCIDEWLKNNDNCPMCKEKCN